MAKEIKKSLSTTFAEYVLFPRLTKKEHRIDKISLKTPLTRFKDKHKSELNLNIPFVSAVMQSVSGSDLAISLAREGGLSFIFCSQPIEEEAEMVAKVKGYKAGFVTPKVILSQENVLKDAINLVKETGHSTILVTEDGTKDTKLLGLITDKDYWIDYDDPKTKIRDLMIGFDKLVYAFEGVSLDEAHQLMRKNKKTSLPIINKNGRVKYLVFKKDKEDAREYPLELIGENKRLLVGAGINTKDYKERVPALVNNGADILVIDSSDGFSEYSRETILWVKKNYPNIKIGAGNVVEKEGFKFLADAGADFIKVGIGGGSICITQEVKGIGRGQASALKEVVEARDKYFKKTKTYIPLCSDGGLVQDSHILIALSIGADFVMMGRYFARCKESPTEKKIVNSQTVKPYWGEGSERARNWQRYCSDEKKLLFEEGVEGYVSYAGSLSDVVRKSVKVIKSTMANLGCKNIEELHKNAMLERRSPAATREGNPHDIGITNSSLGSYNKTKWGK